MSFLEALLLGLIQGITEFLPISSSGHLKLAQTLFGMNNLSQYILFDLVCHLGTLLAVILVFQRDLLEMLKGDRKTPLLLFLGIIPLFPLYFLIHQIEELFNLPQYLGFFFLTTALLLFLGERYALRSEQQVPFKRRCREAFCVGIVQAIAILPGVSRSGATMSAAKFLGWNRQEAARFSFLLAIPTICGGALLQVKRLALGELTVPAVPISCYLVGFLAAFGTGWLALSWLMQWVKKYKLTVFAWYCLFLGIATLIYLNFFVTFA